MLRVLYKPSAQSSLKLTRRICRCRWRIAAVWKHVPSLYSLHQLGFLQLQLTQLHTGRFLSPAIQELLKYLSPVTGFSFLEHGLELHMKASGRIASHGESLLLGNKIGRRSWMSLKLYTLGKKTSILVYRGTCKYQLATTNMTMLGNSMQMSVLTCFENTNKEGFTESEKIITPVEKDCGILYVVCILVTSFNKDEQRNKSIEKH